jgi:DNA-binding CsgD family transcriptional regulator
MSRLRASDLRAIFEFLGEAQSVDGPDPFPRPVLASLRRLVPCDVVGYSELDRVHRVSLRNEEDPVTGDSGPGIETYWRLRDQHPVCHFQDETGDFPALKITDFISRTELRRREIYWEYLRPWRVEHQLSVGLDAPLSHTKIFMFDREDGSDFTERDRAVLDFLRPHLAGLYRAAHLRRRAAGAVALLERTGTAMLLLEGVDRLAFVTPEARRLLGRYFGGVGDYLPAEVSAWLRRRRPADDRLTVDRGDGCLMFELVGSAVLLEEQRGAGPLTEREREILDLVAAGKTNAQIAETIWVAPGTVRKHLENIYEKLGVHSRTAAVAALNQN